MHYFSEKPNSSSNERLIEAILRNKKFIFKTDSGIFSPKKVDKGTKILVDNLELDKKDIVLDVGCGYGVIGVAIADEVNSITMTDINRRALKLAEENVKINKLNNKNISIVQGNIYEGVNDKKYTKIISNPPIKVGKEVIHKIIREGKELLQDNGSIWVVIQTKHGAKSLAKYMEEVFGNVEIITIKGGYRVLMSKKVD
ncbi:MAG TPA: class I SAM-dependent methyltransferase [Methanothermococcus okinawensis]|uniref:Class I SAM-dependent methyltransferase n=1 Tax=Methanothermococcus okinawensis TaxID=155863 RepID=A0A832YTS1_9EURY|nr:class I SAM-dependent methyltransferase [Methanothermococcus okinawensis]